MTGKKKKLSKNEKRKLAIGIIIAIVVVILLIIFVIIPLIKWLGGILSSVLGGIFLFIIICLALDS